MLGNSLVPKLLLITCAVAVSLAATRATYAASASPDASRVLVVFNANSTTDGDNDGVPDSLQAAGYFMNKRGVPADNLLGVSCSTSGGYGSSGYTNYIKEIVLPIRNKLAELGPTNIDIILLCYQMPWTMTDSGGTTISLDNALMGLNYWSTNSDNVSWSYNPYLEATPTFGTDYGHFDHASFKFYGTDMYLVSRLDGPNRVWGVLDLVDVARYGDRYISTLPGYYSGNAYVDSRNLLGAATDENLSTNTYVMSGAYYSYESTDVNIAYGEHYVLSSGLPLKWHQNGNIIGTAGTYFTDGTSAATAPRALLYGGWYAYNNYLKNVWDWLPGSVACDLDSSSFGWDIRSPFTTAWASQAMTYGASCAAGVVNEPYTTGHTRPNILLWAVLQGFNWAEASTLANPAIGWQSMAIGDPLYAPFAPKGPVLDSQAPVFSTGYPNVYQSNPWGAAINVLVDDMPEPEVVCVRVDYGPTTDYGSTSTSRFYGRYHRIALTNVVGGTNIHYQVTVTDPVGNSTSSGDLIFTSPAETPYGGTTQTIPGSIVCVNFDEGGEGVAYHDREPENYDKAWQFRKETGVEINTGSGPYYLFYYCYGGEWLKYTVNVTRDGLYKIDTATKDADSAGRFHIECDGINVTGSLIPQGGSSWINVTSPSFALNAERHVLRLVFEGDAKQRIGSFDHMQFYRVSSISVAITNPTTGKVVSPGANVLIHASAISPYSTIQKVDFFRGTIPLASISSSPFQTTWSNIPPGVWSLSAIAYDSDGFSCTSAVVSVVAYPGSNLAPSIVTQPVSQRVRVHGGAAFYVDASAWPAPVYQWRKYGTNLPGANNAMLAINSASYSSAGAYSAVLSNAAGMVTSAVARLVVTQQVGWVAFNSQATVSPNVTFYSPATPTNGFLTNFLDGAGLEVALTITSSPGAVSSPTMMAAPAPGTPAMTNFDSLVVWASGAAGLQLRPTGTVAYIFTGLDPARKYKLTATAVRAGDPGTGGPSYYSNRWTQAELAGVASFLHAHSAEVLTSNDFPAFLTNSQAALCTGVNTNGDVLVWDRIVPTIGPDGNGAFTLLTSQYTNGIPGSPNGLVPQIPSYTYALGQIRLEETPFFIVLNESASTVTITWPVSSQAWQVFSTDSLTTPRENWTLVTDASSRTNAGRVYLTIPVHAEHRFFDVRYP